jgi:catechol 2,3-dioxygenase-like lactoylglutathione lyase family enzyme
MPSIHGLLETALYVKDLHAAAAFYRRLFHFDVLLESDRLIALDVVGRDVLLLFLQGATKEPYVTSGGTIPGHSASGRSHLAFSIDADEFEPWKQRLEAEGIPLESTVTWDGGAQSLYFRDPDENLVELITPGFWRTQRP